MRSLIVCHNMINEMNLTSLLLESDDEPAHAFSAYATMFISFHLEVFQ